MANVSGSHLIHGVLKHFTRIGAGAAIDPMNTNGALVIMSIIAACTDLAYL
jgi:hypothetical protein